MRPVRRRVVLLLLAGCLLCGAPGARGDGNSPPPPYASDTAIPHPRSYEEGVLTTVNGITFEAGGRTLYVSRWVDGKDYRGKPRARIFRHTWADGRWSPPEPVSFSRRFTDYQPVLSPDGSRLFFTSTRPLPGSETETRQNVWFVERTAAGWGEPQVVAALTTPGWDGHAVAVRSGRLYYVSERPGGRGGTDIWMAEEAADGTYGGPVNVAAVSSQDGDSDLFVDPDERFMIFNRFVEATGSIDLWIAFGSNGDWQPPRPLDAANGPGWELSPTVTPDGRYLFFQRDGILQQIDLDRVLQAEERPQSSGGSR